VDAVITATFPSNLLGRTALPISLLTPTKKAENQRKEAKIFFVTKSGFLLYRRLPSPPCFSAPQIHRKNCAIGSSLAERNDED
jgi:hypothetical protein